MAIAPGSPSRPSAGLCQGSHARSGRCEAKRQWLFSMHTTGSELPTVSGSKRYKSAIKECACQMMISCPPSSPTSNMYQGPALKWYIEP